MYSASDLPRPCQTGMLASDNIAESHYTAHPLLHTIKKRQQIFPSFLKQALKFNASTFLCLEMDLRTGKKSGIEGIPLLPPPLSSQMGKF